MQVYYYHSSGATQWERPDELGGPIKEEEEGVKEEGMDVSASQVSARLVSRSGLVRRGRAETQVSRLADRCIRPNEGRTD